MALGSSPRVRGTVGVDEHCNLGARFIPACAGNGDALICMVSTNPVHPRVCGERLSLIVSARIADPFGNRFIPACAGNGSVSCTSNA